MASLMNPEQMLPLTEVSLEAEALRDLVARDNLALDSLSALVRRRLADSVCGLGRGAPRTCQPH
jgi:hypothetical protein